VITITDNFLKNTDILDDLYQFFHYSGGWQFDFMPAKYISKNNHSSEIDAKISYIIKKICEIEPKFIGLGYEPWVNVLDYHIDHLNHHVDCNEESENIEPAKMTATLYLGSEIEGGDLAIDTVEYNKTYTFYDNIHKLEQNIDNNWIKIPFKNNRLILFDSNYPHAVLPIKNIKNNESRISLVISSWDKKIKVQR
jgi:Rps23 Pro-64 3,4-dihydroxylase Tpa1-like proline 4-hydroxylase